MELWAALVVSARALEWVDCPSLSEVALTVPTETNWETV